jgi:hypothetical protein
MRSLSFRFSYQTMHDFVILSTLSTYTVRPESRCAFRLRYVDLLGSPSKSLHKLAQEEDIMHSDFPNADLQKVFANKIKRVQTCIDAR